MGTGAAAAFCVMLSQTSIRSKGELKKDLNAAGIYLPLMVTVVTHEMYTRQVELASAGGALRIVENCWMIDVF
jgi:hypothetical protein